MTIMQDKPDTIEVVAPVEPEPVTPLTPEARYEQRLFDGQFEILRGPGAGRLLWDRDNPVEVQRAAEAFAGQRAAGGVVYSSTDGGMTGDVVTTFDPEASHLVAVPRIVGG